jgi:hypothetical protein
MDRFASNNFAKAGVEGHFGSAFANTGIEASNNLAGLPVLQRVVVEEVLFDPFVLDDARIKSIIETYKLTNKLDIKRLPRNTIIGKPVIDGAQAGSSDVSSYFLPFFPPHLSLPLTPGETCWVFYENIGKNANYGYWMCRVTEMRNVDDINHTHSDRKFHNINAQDTIARSGDQSATPPSFDNGATFLKGGKKSNDDASATTSGGVDRYKDIIQNSDGGKVHDLEDAPRFTKRPGDLAIMGSNNTLINLGTDRTGPAAEFTSGDKGKTVKGKPASDKINGAGSIDIVVGRGKGKNKYKKVKNTLGKDEVDKSPKNETPEEGGVDLKDDAARLYLSMKTDVDKNFSISIGDEATDVSAAVIKADCVRIIARNDIKILVDEDGASIVLKKNGDIIFTPNSQGIIRLGGESANIALLGILAPPPAGGTVVGLPITDTMGGRVGVGGANGLYASKVLAK